MKKKASIHYFLLVALLAIGLGCKKEEEKPREKTYRTTLFVIEAPHDSVQPHGKPYDQPQYIPIADAKVKLYANQKDYDLDINAIDTGRTDSKGNYSYMDYPPKSGEIVKYFLRVEKNNLNNIRFESIVSEWFPYDDPNGLSNGIDPYDNYGKLEYNKGYNNVLVPLSTTPVRLTFNIYNNGSLITNSDAANVFLYLSEEDYLKRRAYSYSNDSGFAYMNSTFSASRNPLTYKGYSQRNRSSFVIYDLEPRKYWFIIAIGTMNNTTTKFVLEYPLPDNYRINNTFDIGIQ